MPFAWFGRPHRRRRPGSRTCPGRKARAGGGEPRRTRRLVAGAAVHRPDEARPALGRPQARPVGRRGTRTSRPAAFSTKTAGSVMPEGYPAYATLLMTNMPAEATSLAGRYRLRYRGEGQIDLDGAVSRVQRLPGEIVFDFKPGGESTLVVTVSATDPKGTGDYIRDISIVRDEDRAAFDAGEIFNPVFLARMRGVAGLRFMDWMATNASPIEHWEERAPKPGDVTYARVGVPAEVMVDLANALDADPWFTMPHKADDGYFRAFAETLRDGLAGTRPAGLGRIFQRDLELGLPAGRLGAPAGDRPLGRRRAGGRVPAVRGHARLGDGDDLGRGVRAGGRRAARQGDLHPDRLAGAGTAAAGGAALDRRGSGAEPPTGRGRRRLRHHRLFRRQAGRGTGGGGGAGAGSPTTAGRRPGPPLAPRLRKLHVAEHQFDAAIATAAAELLDGSGDGRCGRITAAPARRPPALPCRPRPRPGSTS